MDLGFMLALLEKRFVALSRTERRALAKARLFGKTEKICPCCKTGKLVRVDGWQRNKSPPSALRIN